MGSAVKVDIVSKTSDKVANHSETGQPLRIKERSWVGKNMFIWGFTTTSERASVNQMGNL